MLSTWQNYARFTEERGRLVLNIIQNYTAVKNKTVLDVGCGEGGTAFVFSNHGAKVTAIDIQDNFKYGNQPIQFKIMTAENLLFDDEAFDIIIVQDVLEHLHQVQRVLSEIRRVLKKNGIFYISTPNRLSLLNLISDPHWGLPFISLLPRKIVVLFVKYLFRRDRRHRNDWASLCSLFKLKKLLKNNNLKFEFTNTEAVKFLFKNPTSVVCRSLHLKIVSLLKKRKAEKYIYRIVNDKPGFFNYVINPTWYMVGWRAF